MNRDVGIDDIGFYGGPLTIAYDVIARARGLGDRTGRPPSSTRRSVVPPFEDPVTLAVNAARPLVDAAGAALLRPPPRGHRDRPRLRAAPEHLRAPLPRACPRAAATSS